MKPSDINAINMGDFQYIAQHAFNIDRTNFKKRYLILDIYAMEKLKTTENLALTTFEKKSVSCSA